MISSLPALINKPGIWCLQRDLYYPSKTGAAITISRHNVTIDLNGYRLFGDPGLDTEADGVLMKKRNHIHITNGSIERFRAGVHATGGQNLHIDHMNFDQNRQYGVRQLSVSRNTVIENTTVSRTGGSTRPFPRRSEFPHLAAGIMVGADARTAVGTLVSSSKVADTTPVTNASLVTGVFLGGFNLAVQESHITFDSRVSGDNAVGIFFAEAPGTSDTSIASRNVVTTDDSRETGIFGGMAKDNVVGGFSEPYSVIDAGGNHPVP